MDFVYMGISRNRFLQIYSKENIHIIYTSVAPITEMEIFKKNLRYIAQDKTRSIRVNHDDLPPIGRVWMLSEPGGRRPLN